MTFVDGSESLSIGVPSRALSSWEHYHVCRQLTEAREWYLGTGGSGQHLYLQIWSRHRGLPSSRESHRFLMLNIPWCPHTSPELRCWRSHRIFPSRLHYLSEPHMPRQGMQTEPGGLPPARRPDPKALPSLSLCARPGGIWAVLANAYLLHLHFCFRDESLGEN